LEHKKSNGSHRHKSKHYCGNTNKEYGNTHDNEEISNKNESPEDSHITINDKIKKGEVKVVFCPMHDMLGDVFNETPTMQSVYTYEGQDDKFSGQHKHYHAQECVGKIEF